MISYLLLLFLLGTISTQELGLTTHGGEGASHEEDASQEGEDDSDCDKETPLLIDAKYENCQNFSQLHDKEACSKLCPTSDKCSYRIFKSCRNFFNAQKICRRHGGNLSSIHNACVNNYIARLARCSHLRTGFIWIGARKADRYCPYRNLDGSPLDYTNWACGQPKLRYRRCITLNIHTGKWRNARCRKTRLPFVCTI